MTVTDTVVSDKTATIPSVDIQALSDEQVDILRRVLRAQVREELGLVAEEASDEESDEEYPHLAALGRTVTAPVRFVGRKTSGAVRSVRDRMARTRRIRKGRAKAIDLQREQFLALGTQIEQAERRAKEAERQAEKAKELAEKAKD